MWHHIQSTQVWNHVARVESGTWKKVAVAAACLKAAYGLYYVWATYQVHRKIRNKQRELAHSKDQVRERLLRNGDTEEKGLPITSLNFIQLSEKLQKGELKALDVLHAYQAKALAATDKTNCVVEFIKEAELYAAQCDEMSAAERKGRPLHGIPVSLKENYIFEGYDTTAGMAHFIGKPGTENCVMVTILLKLGAVPFVRTNIPQTMLSFECSNPIYGVTKHPQDPKRGPGGSSGGEGALIAQGGSLLGFGSDIGGSIRIPSHMNGVCGFKPSIGRLSDKGMFGLGRGATIVQSAVGPLAKDVDTLVVAMKSLLGPTLFKLDPVIPPVPFQSQIFESSKPLRIGYFTHNGIIQPVPACSRAVLEVKAGLEELGHTLMEFEPPKLLMAFSYLISAFFGDDAEHFRRLMKHDKLDASFRLIYHLSPAPRLRWLLSKIAKYVFKDPNGAMLAAGNQCTSILSWWKLQENVEEYKNEFIDLWQSQGLDLIICPGFGTSAVPLGKCARINAVTFYTGLFNLLDFPAGSVPVTKVSPQDEADLQDPSKYPAPSLTEKFLRQYGKGSVGLPVNVQCVGLPFQEELVLRLMKEVENIVQGGRVY